MSNYGPPGGPYPGRGRDPQEEPYTEPSDPWGDWGRDENGDGGNFATGYDQQPGYGRGGYDQQQGYGGGYDVTGTGYAQRPAEAAPGGWSPAPPVQPTPQPLPPARKGGGGMMILIGVLVLLVLAGGGTAFYLLNQSREDIDNSATDDPTPQPAGSGTPAPTTGGATPDPSGSAAAVSDARDVKKGECVENVGDERKPVMKIADCDGKSVYEVLARFDAPATGEDDAKKKCEAVEGYTNWYFFNSQLDSLDFVLCLKQR
ncbi:LppU/SCO3897 family protein [Catenuloplanes atrovinosus]|uniref:Flagellar basal body protein FliL n=1 Tax=Catenuloplanes atrovinosus TaxID=137266 RepID=A0AAE4CDA1_9ACTN|nr:hypothetical protein [Catenuloplanes atrovinosus]MDR7280003.1 hypothetical protein [Catenuloplanes atrovinosus]